MTAVFIGIAFRLLIGQGLGMRAMMDAAGMQGRIAGLHVVPAKEISIMVEDELIVVRVAMEERDSEGIGFLLQRSRQEAANNSALGDEGGVRAGG